MSLIKLGYIITIRRIIATWHIEAIVFLGILLAVTLLSSGVVFSHLLSEVSLSHMLKATSAEEKKIWIRAFNNLENPETSNQPSAYTTNSDFVQNQVLSYLSDFTLDHHFILETATFFFEGNPKLEQDESIRPRGKLQYLNSLNDSKNFRLTLGQWPTSSPNYSDDTEAVIDSLGSDLLDITVGDKISIFPATQKDATRAKIDVQIVGIFERRTPNSDYWFGHDKDFSYKDQRWSVVPLFTTEQNITNKLPHEYERIYTNSTWIINLDPDKIKASRIKDLVAITHNIRTRSINNIVHGTTSIKIDRILEQHQKELLVAQVPLLLMVFLVTGILGYHLCLISNLTIKSRSSEIAILKSRGGGNHQLGVLVLVEGLLLSIPAVITGTLLSPFIAHVLGNLFFNIESSRTPQITYTSIGIGTVGALLAVSILVISTIIHARKGIVAFRQSGSRPSRTPFIQRYYIDLLFLVIIGLLWWQVQNQGSFLVQSRLNDVFKVDYTLLVTPIIGLLGIGLLVLRFFPLVVLLLARILEPIGPVWAVQGARRISRDPSVPASLVVLLMLATALGVIGSAFSSTLQQSQTDQAMYKSGSDLRIVRGSSQSLQNSELLDGFLTQHPGLGNIAYAYRAGGHLNTEGFVSTKTATLAIDSAHLQSIAWYRNDFSSPYTIENLANSIKPDNKPWETDGITLPIDSHGISLWVQPNRPYQILMLQARLRDSNGNYFDLPLGKLDHKNWQKHTVSYDALDNITPTRRRSASRFRNILSFADLAPPFTLLALHLTSSTGLEESGAIFFSDLTSMQSEEEPLPYNLDYMSKVHIIEDHTHPGLYDLKLNTSVSNVQGSQSMRFGWSPGGNGLRGVRFGHKETPINAIVSEEILQSANAKVGDSITLGMSSYSLPIKITSFTNYFPTLDPKLAPFVILDRTNFEYYSNMHSQRIAAGPTEIWGDFRDESITPDILIESLKDSGIVLPNVLFSDSLVAENASRPLKNASWGGLLILMFMTLILASLSGILLFAYLDVIQRQGEFALIRTLGSSKGQVLGAVWFSLLLIFAFGIGLGTWAGQIIGTSILPLLEIAEDGQRITPPMLLQTSWASVFATYLVLFAVVSGTVVWLAWFTAKIDIQKVLRAGEDAR